MEHRGGDADQTGRSGWTDDSEKYPWKIAALSIPMGIPRRESREVGRWVGHQPPKRFGLTASSSLTPSRAPTNSTPAGAPRQSPGWTQPRVRSAG